MSINITIDGDCNVAVNVVKKADGDEQQQAVWQPKIFRFYRNNDFETGMENIEAGLTPDDFLHGIIVEVNDGQTDRWTIDKVETQDCSPKIGLYVDGCRYRYMYDPDTGSVGDAND